MRIIFKGDLAHWKNYPRYTCCQSVVTNAPTERSPLEVSEGLLDYQLTFFPHHNCIGNLTQSIVINRLKHCVWGIFFKSGLDHWNNFHEEPCFQSVVTNPLTVNLTLGSSEVPFYDQWSLFYSSQLYCNLETISCFKLTKRCVWECGYRVVWITGTIVPGIPIVRVWWPIISLEFQPWGIMKVFLMIIWIFWHCHC